MNSYKLWLHSDKNNNDWTIDSFDLFNITNDKIDIINYKTDNIILENTLNYLNTLNFSKNYHITLTKNTEYPIHEKYEKASYYSFNNKFNEYEFWTLIMYCFITESNIFTNYNNLYGVSYSCKYGKFTVKLLYNIDLEIENIFNINDEDYIKYILHKRYNLKYKYNLIK